MDRSGNIWCKGSSKNNGGWPVYLLLDKHQSSEKINDSQETNKIPIQTSKSTVNLDNALGGKSYVSSRSVNNLFEIKTSETPSESEEDFVWSINDRFHDNQTKDSGNPTEVRLGEPAHASTGIC
ncbi:7365_t:CDS:1 [Funneliformis caledonium]|uniref:7365_t:CDS:1 n=1 Tax=Funneliformis caledonium TaxID=1117310 RepID=A0A9N9BIU4_9GLOM|nr:7365_t:CDS:1 [Funneliformis caledonium]